MNKTRTEDAEQHGLHTELDTLCKETETRPEGIKALMDYYTDRCDWTEKQAVEHIKKMFADGTIETLKALK